MSDDLFENHRVPPAEPYVQVRLNSVQLMEDRAFYQLILRACYEAGPDGLTMRALMKMGDERKWWQKTSAKHFGEKMRAAWAYGLLVVSEYPGHKGTMYKRVVHPAFFTVTFQSSWLQGRWEKLDEALGTLDFMPQK